MNKPNLFENTSIDQATFLAEFWHKKPIVLPQAVVGDQLNILPTTQQLQQLSCNDDIQSRIVFKNSETSYDVEYGPFDQDDWNNLDDECWNLLVSDIDKWLPETKILLKDFQFIRNWLFDDIMLSCGSINGTVGPHTDQYDVFLLQVQGQRQWHFSETKNRDYRMIDDQPLKLIADYKADKTIILNPGDILYIPPEVAHHGIALTNDCVTCSIGTRTPSHAELMTSFVDHLSQKISDDKRFNEPVFPIYPKVGEITKSDLTEASYIISNNLFKQKQMVFNEWFGQFMSEYRSLFYEFNQLQESSDLDKNKTLINSPFSKSCYLINKDMALLFIDGKSFHSSIELAQWLCDRQQLTPEQWSSLSKHDQKTVIKLFENGSLVHNQ